MLQCRGLQDVPPKQVRVGEAMQKEGNIARRRSISIRIDDVVELSPGGSGEEGVSKAWKWFAVEAPVLLLSWRPSVLV